MAKALSRAIDRSAALRAIFKSPPALHLVRTVRASRAVSEPLRFIALQLVSERAAEHRLTGSGLRVHLRHRTRDVDIFKEVFDTGYGPGVYEPPAPVAAALDAKAAPTMLDLGANMIRTAKARGARRPAPGRSRSGRRAQLLRARRVLVPPYGQNIRPGDSAPDHI